MGSQRQLGQGSKTRLPGGGKGLKGERKSPRRPVGEAPRGGGLRVERCPPWGRSRGVNLAGGISAAPAVLEALWVRVIPEFWLHPQRGCPQWLPTSRPSLFPWLGPEHPTCASARPAAPSEEPGASGAKSPFRERMFPLGSARSRSLECLGFFLIPPRAEGWAREMPAGRRRRGKGSAEEGRSSP